MSPYSYSHSRVIKSSIKTEVMEDQDHQPQRRRSYISHRRRSPSRSRSLSDSWRVFDKPRNRSRSDGRPRPNRVCGRRQDDHQVDAKRRMKFPEPGTSTRSRSPQLFVIPPGIKSEGEVSTDNNGNLDMRTYLIKALEEKGLRKATEAVEDVLASLTSVVDTAEVEKVQVYSLAALLDKAGYRSGHVGAHMVASLVIEFMKMDATKPVRDIAEDLLNVTNPRRDLAKKDALREEEGFVKMTDKFSFYLRRHEFYDDEVGRDLAKCMVGLWRNYGVRYQELKDICSHGRYVSKSSNLWMILNRKVDEGHPAPKLFRFKTLIDFTIKTFD